MVSSVTLQEVLSLPANKPLSQEEDQALGSLLRRKVAQTGTSIGLPVYTGGRPAKVSVIPSAQRGSSEASDKSKKRRQHMLQEVERVISGSTSKDIEAQMAFNISRLSRQERERS